MEQAPQHHREGIQDLMDKAFDEGQHDNKEFNDAQEKIAEITGVKEEEREKLSSPELAETVARLKEAGYLDTLFEGKETHSLTIRPLTKEEALGEYKNSGGNTWVFDELEKNMPYTMPRTETLDVMIMNFGRSIESDEVLAEMNKLGVHPLTYEELIQYGNAHPSHQEQNVLIGFGTKHTFSNGPLVPSLGSIGDERRLSAYRCSDLWGAEFRFLVVSK